MHIKNTEANLKGLTTKFALTALLLNGCSNSTIHNPTQTDADSKADITITESSLPEEHAQTYDAACKELKQLADDTGGSFFKDQKHDNLAKATQGYRACSLAHTNEKHFQTLSQQCSNLKARFTTSETPKVEIYSTSVAAATPHDCEPTKVYGYTETSIYDTFMHSSLTKTYEQVCDKRNTDQKAGQERETPQSVEVHACEAILYPKPNAT